MKPSIGLSIAHVLVLVVIFIAMRVHPSAAWAPIAAFVIGAWFPSTGFRKAPAPAPAPASSSSSEAGFIRHHVLISLATVGALALVALFSACGAATYGEELDTCVMQAKTLADSQACRCQVNQKYGRPCRPPVALKEGGPDGQ